MRNCRLWWVVKRVKLHTFYQAFTIHRCLTSTFTFLLPRSPLSNGQVTTNGYHWQLSLEGVNLSSWREPGSRGIGGYGRWKRLRDARTAWTVCGTFRWKPTRQQIAFMKSDIFKLLSYQLFNMFNNSRLQFSHTCNIIYLTLLKRSCQA